MTHRSFFRFTALLLAPLLAAAAFALPRPQPDGGDSAVTVKAVVQRPAVEQGGKLVVAVELDHKPHHHSWPAKEVKLPEAIDEFAIRTELSLPIDEKATKAAKDAKKATRPEKLDKAAEAKFDAELDAIKFYAFPAWIASVDGVQYPKTKEGKVPDPMGGERPVKAPLYEGKAVAFFRVNVRPDAALGEQVLRVALNFQTCNDQVCLPPREDILEVKVKVVAKGASDAGLTADTDAALFATYDAKQWGTGTPLVAPPITTAPSKPSSTPTPTASATPPGGTGGATLYGWNLGTNALLIFIVAALGGAVLNLTPCVLPIIPIKILGLTQHATSRRHAIVLGLWMAAGVVAFWTVIGLPMAIFSRSLDPSQFIFGIWWITFGIGLLIAIFGLGIMGLFTLNLPQSVYAVETKADSPMGSLMYGVMAGVLGLPCFGFVAGGLLAAAATLPTLAILAIFVGIGVGMAAPYLVLSAYPQLLKFVPRTGPASELVKQIMGLLLLAAAAYFVTAGIRGLLIERPYLGGSMTWWAVGFFVLIASVWMFIRTAQITRRPLMLGSIAILAVAMTLGIGIFANGRLNSDRETFFERQAALAGSPSQTLKEVPAGVWLEYTPELFASVRANGQPVFLDFTADWCITCKALKAAVLDDLKTTFKSRGVVLMEVDCTVRNSPGSSKLKELGRTGVPTWVVFGPGSDSPRFIPVETPTPGTIIAELDAAGIPAPSAAAMDNKPR